MNFQERTRCRSWFTIPLKTPPVTVLRPYCLFLPPRSWRDFVSTKFQKPNPTEMRAPPLSRWLQAPTGRMAALRPTNFAAITAKKGRHSVLVPCSPAVSPWPFPSYNARHKVLPAGTREMSVRVDGDSSIQPFNLADIGEGITGVFLCRSILRRIGCRSRHKGATKSQPDKGGCVCHCCACACSFAGMHVCMCVCL